MKAEDVDAALVARAEAAREDALRKWHIKFRAGQQTEPGHVLGMRAALAAVLPEIQAQVLEAAATTVAREVGIVWPSQRHPDVAEAASYTAEVLRANARAARDGKPAPYAARLTATTEETK